MKDPARVCMYTVYTIFVREDFADSVVAETREGLGEGETVRATREETTHTCRDREGGRVVWW